MSPRVSDISMRAMAIVMCIAALSAVTFSGITTFSNLRQEDDVERNSASVCRLFLETSRSSAIIYTVLDMVPDPRLQRLSELPSFVPPPSYCPVATRLAELAPREPTSFKELNPALVKEILERDLTRQEK